MARNATTALRGAASDRRRPAPKRDGPPASARRPVERGECRDGQRRTRREAAPAAIRATRRRCRGPSLDPCPCRRPCAPCPARPRRAGLGASAVPAAVGGQRRGQDGRGGGETCTPGRRAAGRARRRLLGPAAGARRGPASRCRDLAGRTCRREAGRVGRPRPGGRRRRGRRAGSVAAVPGATWPGGAAGRALGGRRRERAVGLVTEWDAGLGGPVHARSGCRRRREPARGRAGRRVVSIGAGADYQWIAAELSNAVNTARAGAPRRPAPAAARRGLGARAPARRRRGAAARASATVAGRRPELGLERGAVVELPSTRRGSARRTARR